VWEVKWGGMPLEVRRMAHVRKSKRRRGEREDVPRSKARPPDILVAVDVNLVKLRWKLLLLHTRHVIDHLEHDKAGKHRKCQAFL